MVYKSVNSLDSVSSQKYAQSIGKNRYYKLYTIYEQLELFNNSTKTVLKIRICCTFENVVTVITSSLFHVKFLTFISKSQDNTTQHLPWSVSCMAAETFVDTEENNF